MVHLESNYFFETSMLGKYTKVAIVVLLLVASSLATASVIYLTPLRYTDFIEPTIHDIDARDFYETFKQNPDKYIFIDVRPLEAYDANHALGSISMPVWTLFDTRHTLPKKGKEIVLICSGGRASGVGYGYLEHYGFHNISRIAGGIEGFMAAGLPTEPTKK